MVNYDDDASFDDNDATSDDNNAKDGQRAALRRLAKWDKVKNAVMGAKNSGGGEKRRASRGSRSRSRSRSPDPEEGPLEVAKAARRASRDATEQEWRDAAAARRVERAERDVAGEIRAMRKSMGIDDDEVGPL